MLTSIDFFEVISAFLSKCCRLYGLEPNFRISSSTADGIRYMRPCHLSHPPPTGESKIESSNAIMSTSFALNVGPITFIADKISAEIGTLLANLACSKSEFLLFWTTISTN